MKKRKFKRIIAFITIIVLAVGSMPFFKVLESFASGATIVSPPGTTYKEITASDVYTESDYYKAAPKTLGIANGFHLIAFDTATLESHTNGNLLANSINGSTNFGTNDITSEVSYIRNIIKMNSTAGSNKASVLAIGSAIAFAVVNQADRTLDGNQLSSPANVLQDTSTIKYIDLDSAKAQAKDISKTLSSTGIAAAGGVAATYDFTDMNQKYIAVQSEKTEYTEFAFEYNFSE